SDKSGCSTKAVIIRCPSILSRGSLCSNPFTSRPKDNINTKKSVLSGFFLDRFSILQRSLFDFFNGLGPCDIWNSVTLMMSSIRNNLNLAVAFDYVNSKVLVGRPSYQRGIYRLSIQSVKIQRINIYVLISFGLLP